MDLGLRGKTALITGASRGIGRAVAHALAAEGVHVHLTARTAVDLERVQGELAQFGVRASTWPMDLSRRGVPERLARTVGEIDILVNNAGAIPAGSLASVDEENWRSGWDLKVFGYINLARAAYRQMRARQAGVIVNVIGTGGERPDAAYIAGSTANAGLMAFTRALGGTSPGDGIRVVGVNPGLTRTERLEELARAGARMAGRPESEWSQMLGQLPFNRPGEPREVADLVAFLVSNRAAYISGTVVTIDGGRSGSH